MISNFNRLYLLVALELKNHLMNVYMDIDGNYHVKYRIPNKQQDPAGHAKVVQFFRRMSEIREMLNSLDDRSPLIYNTHSMGQCHLVIPTEQVAYFIAELDNDYKNLVNELLNEEKEINAVEDDSLSEENGDRSSEEVEKKNEVQKKTDDAESAAISSDLDDGRELDELLDGTFEELVLVPETPESKHDNNKQVLLDQEQKNNEPNVKEEKIEDLDSILDSTLEDFEVEKKSEKAQIEDKNQDQDQDLDFLLDGALEAMEMGSEDTQAGKQADETNEINLDDLLEGAWEDLEAESKVADQANSSNLDDLLDGALDDLAALEKSEQKTTTTLTTKSPKKNALEKEKALIKQIMQLKLVEDISEISSTKQQQLLQENSQALKTRHSPFKSGFLLRSAPKSRVSAIDAAMNNVLLVDKCYLAYEVTEEPVIKALMQLTVILLEKGECDTAM